MFFGGVRVRIISCIFRGDRPFQEGFFFEGVSAFSLTSGWGDVMKKLTTTLGELNVFFNHVALFRPGGGGRVRVLKPMAKNSDFRKADIVFSLDNQNKQK